MHLAKEVATLQELSGGRFTLGVGMAGAGTSFDFMGAEEDELLSKMPCNRLHDISAGQLR